MLRRGISPFALFATMFVVLCGGPFGMEEIVPLAGPGMFALVLVVLPVIWAVPSALISAELISELPLQGGLYQWFRAGLGPFWSFVFTYLEWLSWVLDAALYPALLAAYFMAAFTDEPSVWVRGAVCLTLIWGCAWLNIRGVKEVGFFSTVMTVVILVPVIVMTLLAVPHLSFAQFSDFVPEGQSTPEALKYAVIWAIWSYSGYAGLASASEEIVEPERTYPKVLAFFLPLSVVVYVLPLWAGLAADPDWQAWGPAQLSVAAGVLGGTLLATMVGSAAQVAALGLYNGEQLILGRYLYAMARDGVLPPALARLHPRHQSPHVALIFHAVLFSALVFAFDFVQLLVLGTLVSMPVFVLTFLSPLVLRYKYPNLRGPFRIPGGWPVIIPTALVPTTLCFYVIYNGSAQELIGMGAFFAAAPVLYFAARWYNLRRGIDTEAPNPIEVLQALERGRADAPQGEDETRR